MKIEFKNLKLYFIDFSFSGCGNALSFKDLDKSDIGPIENNVRNTLRNTLQSVLAEKNIEYTHTEKVWFFGPFANEPERFEFPPGEIGSLFTMVRFVKRIVDEPNECGGLGYFANPEVIAKKGKSYEEPLVQSVFGFVFGCIREKKQVQLEVDIVERKKELFKKASGLFQQYEHVNEIVSIQQFTLELVDVRFIDQKWKGIVKCIF